MSPSTAEPQASQKTLSVTLRGPGDQQTQAQLHYQQWTPQEVQKRAIKRTAKLLSYGLGACLVILFIPGVHWSLLVLLPGVLFSSIPLYLKFSREKANFDSAQGLCPHCQKESRLEPYFDSRLQSKIKLLCPPCGQNSSANISL